MTPPPDPNEPYPGIGSAFLLSLLFSFLIVLDFANLARGARHLHDTRLQFIYDEVSDSLFHFGRVLGQALEAQLMIAILNTGLTSVGLAITVFWILVLIASYAHPVWVLRGRIRAAKDVELSYVFRALRGDPGAMARSARQTERWKGVPPVDTATSSRASRSPSK